MNRGTEPINPELQALLKNLERENFTGQKLIEINFNQGKVSRVFEYQVKREIKKSK